MKERPDSAKEARGLNDSELREPLDWSVLLRLDTLDGLLGEIGPRLGRGHPVGLVLEVVGPPAAPVAGYRGQELTGGEAREVVEIPGRPSWRLICGRPASAPAIGEALVEAGAVIAAWRGARTELERAESGLEARTRELGLLQELSRSSAEAHGPTALFAKAAKVLQDGTGAEAVIVAWDFDGEPRALGFVTRPFSRPDLERVAVRAGSLLGWSADSGRAVEESRLDTFDETPGCRSGLRDEDPVVIPLWRRERTVASLAVVFPEKEEARLRLLYGAANQISLHLDRILTVREAEQDRFRSILESMPQAVLLTDASLRVLQANPAADRLLRGLPGLPSPESVTRLGDLDLESLARPVIASQGGASDGEAHLDDGSILNVTLSGVVGDEGGVEGLVLVIADVTERRRLQEQLAQTEKLSSLGQMISGIAHELNNPLASVLGFSQLVQTTTPDEKLAHRLEMILREARRCQKIVHNLLSFARGHDPERKSFSLNEVVTTVVALVGYQLRVGNIEMRTELDRNLPSIKGDSHQLQQVLLNLITNAQHAIRDAGRGGTISVTTRVGPENRVVLEVRDDGPGIPRAILSRIYDPFFTTKRTGEGTGLGLSIVYGIISAHGGTVRVESQDGEGTTFRIELPVGGRESAEPERDTGPRAERTPRTGSVLVVDDEEAVARLIGETLHAEGHQVVQAQDREEALARLSEERFDLIVLDLKMPGMGDDPFIDELEKLSPGLSGRLLLITGDTVSRTPEIVARRMGVPVIHKPFDLDDLREAVRSRLESRG